MSSPYLLQAMYLASSDRSCVKMSAAIDCRFEISTSRAHTWTGVISGPKGSERLLSSSASTSETEMVNVCVAKSIC